MSNSLLRLVRREIQMLNALPIGPNLKGESATLGANVSGRRCGFGRPSHSFGRNVDKFAYGARGGVYVRVCVSTFSKGCAPRAERPPSRRMYIRALYWVPISVSFCRAMQYKAAT